MGLDDFIRKGKIVVSGKRSTRQKKAPQSHSALMEEKAAGVHERARSLKTFGKVMGIDLSLVNTGMNIFTEEGRLLRSFTLRHPFRKQKTTRLSEVKRIERLLNLTNEIVDVCETFKIMHVGIEGFAYARGQSAHQIGEIAGCVKTQLWLAKKIVPLIVQPSAGRKFMFGYGCISKDEIWRILVNVMGLKIEDEHQADAYVVTAYTFHDVAVPRIGDGVDV